MFIALLTATAHCPNCGDLAPAQVLEGDKSTTYVFSVGDVRYAGFVGHGEHAWVSQPAVCPACDAPVTITDESPVHFQATPS